MHSSTPREILGLLTNKCVSISITLLILLVFGLLLWSNIGRSAWVRLQFYVVEDDSYDEDTDENVYSIKFWKLVTTLWESDSYYLAIIVLCLSLLFTYIKMFCVLLSIWISMHWTPRAKFLSILTQLGKFAMAIVFLVVFLVNAVHQSISATVTVSSSSSSTEYDLEFDLTIEVDYAIVVFAIAIIFSMLLTEMVAYCNKRHRHDTPNVTIQHSHTSSYHNVPADEPGWQSVDRGCCVCCPESMVLRAPIAISMYTKCQEGCGAFFIASIKRIIMLAVLGVCIISTICAYSTDFVKIEYTGTISDYMADPTREYSFRDFGIQEADYTDYVNYGGFIAAVYTLFVVIVPLLVICFLIALWFIPFPNFIYQRLRPLIWYLNAWAMLDIMFLVAIGTGYTYGDLYETVVDDQIGDYCDDLADYIDDADCADVSVTVQEGTWWALIASVTMWISVIYSVYYTDPAYSWTKEAMDDSDGHPYEDVGLAKHGGYNTDEEDVGFTTQV